VIPGIPSFCAAAARINEPLGEEHEQIHIIPSSYDIENALNLPGTKVLMKAGRKIGYVIDDVNKKGLKMILAENIGMLEEKIVYNPTADIEAGYYTQIIIKDNVR
jgi:precorrin-2/cobalt-factor-2 C20-methyltransferase